MGVVSAISTQFNSQFNGHIDNERPLIVVLEGRADEMCLISDTLQHKAAHRVLGYVDPEKAYNRIIEALPALAIIDADFTLGAGRQLIEKIRCNGRLETMPLIAIVADEAGKDSTGARADCFLTRPFDAETLSKTVEGLLKEKTL